MDGHGCWEEGLQRLGETGLLVNSDGGALGGRYLPACLSPNVKSGPALYSGLWFPPYNYIPTASHPTYSLRRRRGKDQNSCSSLV